MEGATASGDASTLLAELSFWELGNDQRGERKQEAPKPRTKLQHEKPEATSPPCHWKTAKDPATGKIYYYDAISRKTQWEKPKELRLQEKRRKEEKRDRDVAFFQIMERNIRASLQRGERVPGISIATPAFTEPPKDTISSRKAPRVRTISGMNEHWLKELSPRTTTTTVLSANHHHKQPKLPQPLPPRRTPIARDDQEDTMLETSPPTRTTHLSSSDEEEDDLLRGVDFVVERHVRRNTYDGRNTSDSTMDQPDIQATIRTVCSVIRAHILQSNKQKTRNNAIPNVNLGIFSDGNLELPSLQDVHDFYSGFYRRSQMEFDAIILSLIYVERLIKETEGMLMPSPDNWQSLLFSCMVLASKVWDDLSMWNVDFSNVSGSGNFHLQRINELERAVLKCLNYAVVIPASEYAKYYYLLRNMMIRGGMLEETTSSATPPRARQLQDKTRRYQDTQLKQRRALSVDWTEPVLKEAVCLAQLTA